MSVSYVATQLYNEDFMCTADDLIKELQKIPKETIVNVLSVESAGWDNKIKWEELDINKFSENFDFVDLKENIFATDEEKKKIPTLDLGFT